MYELPNFDFKKIQERLAAIAANRAVQGWLLVLVIVIALGFASGKISWQKIKDQSQKILQNTQENFEKTQTQSPPSMYVSRIGYEQAIIDVVKSASPSVVSIVISKDLPVYETQYRCINPFGDNPFGFDVPCLQVPENVQRGTEKQQVGAGSGFIVSADGLILTNKHVVIDSDAEYTVFTNDGKKYPAKVVARDPVQDLAAIKIQSDKQFTAIALGNSDGIQIGQGAIAIGNALGEFRNTVSVGIISGLGRTISASSDRGFSETLENIIQTDAAINPGNSGGPLLNLQGEVIGVNVAMAQGAQTIGFAIPINIAKRDIDQVQKTNKITYAFLGVRYVLVDESVKEKYQLSVDYGVILLKGENGEAAVTKGSAAETAGLKEKDVIIEINGKKISQENSLASEIQKYIPGNQVTLKILRNNVEMTVSVTLGERP